MIFDLYFKIKESGAHELKTLYYLLEPHARLAAPIIYLFQHVDCLDQDS
jgi:hypothetical protein